MAASESCGHRSSSLASSASNRQAHLYRRSEPKPILSPSAGAAANTTTPTSTTTRQQSAARRTRNNYINNNGLSELVTLKRLEPLTIEEYENNHRLLSTDLELIERVFLGSIENNQLRAALWPYLFGLIVHRGRFEKVPSSITTPTIVNGSSSSSTHSQTNGFIVGHLSPPKTINNNNQQQQQQQQQDEYVFIEHEANANRWKELEQSYLSYEAQWKAITRDQEERFTLFRERKALIGRDVIRCDRLHPFYAEKPKNLDLLSSLLMTYMMFDFDIGYVQGMSDLAGPILYIFNGDLIKSFWVFVEVMKLVRRNFEHTQKSIHFQLSCLFELIRITDSKFAKYLEQQESSNCFFAFRAIVCQFKRELMKDDQADYYDKCLQLWDTIWCVERRCVLEANLMVMNQGELLMGAGTLTNCSAMIHSTATTTALNSSPRSFSHHHNASWKSIPHYLTSFPSPLSKSPSIITTTTTPNGGTTTTTNGYSSATKSWMQQQQARDQNQPDTPRHNLTETEMYILALCLVMILRERDTLLNNRLDGNDIHLHFIEPKLSNDLNGFIQSAINTYRIIKNDLDLMRLTSPKSYAQNNNNNNTNDIDEQQLPLAATLAPLIINNNNNSNKSNHNHHRTNTTTTNSSSSASSSSSSSVSNNSSSNYNATTITTTASCSNILEEFHLGSPGSLEGYDFLNDFLIINRVPGR